MQKAVFPLGVILCFLYTFFPLAAVTENGESGNSNTMLMNKAEGILDGTTQGNTFYYVYEHSKQYEIYTSPGRITAIILQAGEKIIHAPALGEVDLFSVGAVEAYYKGELRQQLHIKALQSSSLTNLILNTNKRSYFLMLNSTPFSYMTAVAWHYPGDNLNLLEMEPAASNKRDNIIERITDTLNFRYEIIMARGKKPGWFPVRVFDDGNKTYIQFPNAAKLLEVPVLFVLRSGELNVVSYRIESEYYVFDGLFRMAELRSSGKKRRHSLVVRIIKK